MATIGSSIIGASGGSTGATTPKNYNVTTDPTPSTEASQVLTSSTKQFTIRVRGSAELKIGFSSAELSSTPVTVPKGNTATWSDLNFSGTLYFSVNKASQVVEIMEWS
jgi:hypothetical protein